MEALIRILGSVIEGFSMWLNRKHSTQTIKVLADPKYRHLKR